MIKKLWCGDYPLYITFWGFTVLPGVLSNQVAIYLTSNTGILNKFLYSISFFFILGFLYFCFMVVACFRSANKYKGWFLWAGLVRVSAFFSALALLTYSPHYYTILKNVVSNNLYIISDKNIDEELKKENKNLPKKIDRITRLDFVIRKKKMINFKYTVTGVFSKNSKPYIQMANILKKNNCDKVKDFLNHGYSYAYHYYNTNQIPKVKIYLDREICTTNKRPILMLGGGELVK